MKKRRLPGALSPEAILTMIGLAGTIAVRSILVLLMLMKGDPEMGLRKPDQTTKDDSSSQPTKTTTPPEEPAATPPVTVEPDPVDPPARVASIIEDAESDELDISDAVVKAYKLGVKDGQKNKGPKVESGNESKPGREPCWYCGTEFSCRQCRTQNARTQK